MKSPKRPPLKLTDDEVVAPIELSTTDQTPPDEATSEFEPIPEPDFEIVQPKFEPPMSERRRRRLLEEQRLAEERALAAERGTAPVNAKPTPEAPVDMAVAVGQPPAPFELSKPPAVKTVQAKAQAEPSGRHAYVIAGIASALWIGGVASWAAYEFGAGGAELDPLRIAIYALIALAPAGLAIMLAHAVRQGAGLAAETRRARQLAEALVAPTALAAQQTGEVLQSLRSDIDHATLAAERARNDMALLREALAQETTRLNEAAENAGRTARRLTENLGRERDQMQTLGIHLDTQASGVIDAVERQSRMVADASDLAQAQLREAEAALAARAADLAAAAGEAQDAARVASDDLARQTIRLENAGSGVAEQIQSVEEGLSQQRAALVTAAYALRTDQEDFSAQVESQRAQLIEHLSATRSAAGDLDRTTQTSVESMRDLVEAATDQFRALVDMSQREADGFDSATKLALDRFEALAAEARDALMEETRRALEQMRATAEDSRAAAADAAEQARLRTDRLGESLFDAAQKADTAADARIADARRIVTETSGLVDETGERMVSRLETLVARLNSALSEIDTAVADIDERAARLPQEARARADAVRATVEEGLASLSAASRKAAEDTEALDVGFQDRVRRNYDMLTEAVRLMGVVSGDTTPARRREPAAEIEARPEPRPERRTDRPTPPASPPAEERRFGLRSRLRLEPAETPPPSADKGLDWSDLIDGDDDNEAPLELDTPSPSPAEAEALSDRVAAAIRRMGVDPNALLPRSRVEEAARAFSNGDPDAARQIVRRVAPAAVRSVSRRVLSDAELRADAEHYVRNFAVMLNASARAGDSAAVQSSLASDSGRAFMLLDAAVGDLG
ncbi:ATPase involved in DNA repair [Brevundimonas vesicularis]|uniref:ATPase involved in DNA repair n=1 Tax=Brevundimonas vesicularis TaxID=41276 RepID=A0A2X1B6N7_BREVE|nr:tipN [Brevundimonas vesicularis]SPU52487.1 ATPase involved in DNA repair [Brevundimonas vesicularis]